MRQWKNFFIIAALLIPVVIWSGTNTLISVSGGKVKTAHVNQFYTALNQDLVPRNSAGAPTAGGGSLGTSTFTWLDGFLSGSLYFPGSTKWKLSKDGSDNYNFDFNGINRFRISSAGVLTIGSIGNANVITRDNLVAVGQQVSGGSGLYNNTTATFTDVTTAFNITVTGRPVVLTLLSTGISTPSYIGVDRTGGAGETDVFCVAQFKLVRNGVLDFSLVSITGISRTFSDGTFVNRVAPGTISGIDTPSAGTHSYKLQGAASGGTSSGCAAVAQQVKLMAYEL